MSKIPPVIIEIKPSKMIPDEVGVFATRKILKNSVIVSASHYADLEFSTWEEFKKLDTITQQKVLDYCPGRVDGFYHPKNLNLLSIGWHINHSCDPNIGFNDNDDFVAMKDIEAGEELYWDYTFDETNPNFKLKCICKTPKCRKMITGNDWIKHRDNKKLFEYLSRHVKEMIAKESKIIL